MSDPLFSVADQIVIISGGSRGIGKAIAQGFAVRGAHTVITGREADSLNTTADEITEAGSVHEVIPVMCDVGFLINALPFSSSCAIPTAHRSPLTRNTPSRFTRFFVISKES